MNKYFCLLLLIISGSALSVRVADNLKSINANDICYIYISIVKIDDERMPELEFQAEKSIRDKNMLYSKVFDSDVPKNCTVNLIYSFSALKTNTGNYVYAANYSVIPELINVAGFMSLNGGGLEKDIQIEYPVIWDSGSLGITNSYPDLVGIVIAQAGRLFEYFLFDWMVVH